MYIKSSLKTNDNSDFSLSDLIGAEFDVILVEPPLHEYKTSNGVYFDKYFSWDEVKNKSFKDFSINFLINFFGLVPLEVKSKLN